MPDGLYAFVNADTAFIQTCQFPFGTAQCHKTLARLRRKDPPYSDCEAPDVAVGTISPEDRVIAYHFLVRATFFMMMGDTPQADKAIPYLMAFGAMSQVRFACVDVQAHAEGMSIRPITINETDFDTVKGMFDSLLETVH